MSEDKLRQRVKELEEEVVFKQNELLQYKTQILQINHKLEHLISQMTVDQRLMQKIQKALSPTEIPRIPGFDFSTKFIPGHQFGGDYFDIFEHEDKMRFGIILASCTGYTMSALLLSVLMKLSTHIEAKKGLEPHLVINLLASEIQKDLKKTDQANIFYGVFDRRTYTLNYCMAGDIAGYLQKAQQPKVLQNIEAFGPALSLQFQKAQGSVTVELQSRDRLILCSSGVALSENLQSEIYGLDRLKRSILGVAKGGVHEVRNEVLFQLERFTKTTEPARDLTVLVTEVQDRVIKLTTAPTI